MLLLLIGWVVLSVFLALLIGSAIHEGGKPAGVSDRDWVRVSERHQPHARWRRAKR